MRRAVPERDAERYDDVTYVYDDVTYVYDDVTYVYAAVQKETPKA